MAKLYAGDTAVYVADRAVQIAGGFVLGGALLGVFAIARGTQ